MDFIPILRLTGYAVAAISLAYCIQFIARRFAFHGKGPAEESRGIPLSSKEIGALCDERMEWDRLSLLSHKLSVGGLFAGTLGHVFSALENVPLSSFSTVASLLTALAFLGGGAALITGSVIPLVRRMTGSPRRFTRAAGDILPLISLALIGLSGISYSGAQHLGGPAFLAAMRLFHVLSMSVFLFVLPRSKMFHMIVFNVLKRAGIFAMSGTLAKDKGVEAALSSGTVDGIRIGWNGAQDLSRRQRLETDACVFCGLCDAACPSRLAGKEISPHYITRYQKKQMDAAMRGRVETVDRRLVDMAFECTNCYACETACPLLLRKVDGIAAVRRNMLLENGQTLPEWKTVLRNSEKSGNVFGLDDSARRDLLRRAAIPFLSEGDGSDYVLWLGCYGAYDPKMRGVASALAALCRAAGKKLTALETERCCGDMVRRIGDEYGFHGLVEKNSRTLASVGDAPLVTLCPHCAHTLGNEYRDFGVDLRVFHYTEILMSLAAGMPNPIGIVTPKPNVAYHDSCWLARIRGIYGEPRVFIERIRPDARLIPLDAEGADTLCCGGGGGRVAAEEGKDTRISMKKIAELKEKGIGTLLTSCPYCLTMFTDSAADSGIRVTDLLEFAALGLGRRDTSNKQALSVMEGANT